MGYKKHAKTSRLPWKLFGCFLLLSFYATSAFSQASPERYVVDHWTTEDGLPVNSVNEVIQSRDGYIWIATFDGLVRFDGLQFKVFDTSTHPILASNRILRVFELNDGSLWILTEQGFLIRYVNGKMERIDQWPEYHGKATFKFFSDHRNWLWLGSDRGLNIYRNGSIEPYKPEIIQGKIDKIYVERSGAVWFRDRSSLDIFRFHNNRLKTMAKATRISDFNAMLQAADGSFFLSTGSAVYRFMGDSLLNRYPRFRGELAGISFHQLNGDVLMTTTGEGAYRFRDSNFEKIEVPDQSQGLHRHSFYQDKKGNLWKFSRYRIYKNDQLVYRSNAQIRSFTFDEEGSIWLATNARGLFRLKSAIFNVYSTDQGLPGGNIYPILETEDGSIWLGTHKEGLVRLKEGIETGFTFSDRDPNRPIRTLAQQSDGTLLAGLYNSGVYHLSRAKLLSPIRAPKSLQNATVYSIFEDSKQRLWVGSRVGLFLRTDNTWDHFTDEDQLPHNHVRYVTEAPDGSIWFATNGGGIVRFQDEHFTSFGTDEGLSSDLVRDIHIEVGSNKSNYILWIGTEGRGLNRIPIQNNRWNEQDITYYDESVGLFDNSVHRILDDGLGHFWLSSNGGIFRVAKTELNAFYRGETKTIRSVGYTEKDGLLNREANGGIQPAGIKASDGRLWFPTQDGAVVVDPADIQSNKMPPPVVIEVVTSDDQTVWNGNNAQLELKTGQRNFEIKYTALSLLVPEKNQFRYRLEGFDEQWRSVENRRTAFYTNVPPGEYTFQVIASNNNGVWNEQGATLEIVVDPYFYETTWFYVLCATGVVLLIFVEITYRTRRLAEAERKLTALVKERTDELQKEKQKTEEQAEKLQKLDEVKSRFFANISHEFRTPITLIINPLKQMVTGAFGRFSGAVSKRHNIMLRNSYRLLRLIEQLLDLSELEESQVHLNVREIEIVSFAKNICELFDITAGAKNIEMTVQCNCRECWIWADKDKMEKIIANLITNAIKYTDPGGAVDIRFRETDSACEIILHDTGAGIGKEQRQHIFDRFYQVDSGDTRKSEGVGIGLALVKEFVELHKGEISIESEEGEGTCFTVVFRKGCAHFDEKFIADVDSSDNPVETLSAPSYMLKNNPTTEIFGKAEPYAEEADKTTVMVLEDNADLRGFLCEILSQTYRVFEAGNGETALGLIREELPDLIVADIMMPGMDGLTLNRELKKDPSLASIPFIFLTAKAATEEKIEGFAEGADDYLTKPFDAKVLKARIANLIKSRMRLRNLLREETNGQTQSTRKDIDSFLISVNEVLEEKFNHPELSVSNLADSLHIDRTHLYRKLKEKTDLTPQQYILRFRLNKAARLFQEQRGTVSEVAYAVGFNSLSYFAERFREQFQVNPSEYLAEIT